MVKKILIGVGAVVVLFLGLVMTQPAEFRLERAASIDAPADVVYGLINDLHAWEGWSPWEKLDPGMKRTFEGPSAGVGAIYSWVGNDQVGEGRMTITGSTPNENVAIKLEFMKPWEATNEVVLALKGDGEKTNVTWSMAGTNNFMAKAMHLFMDMEKMVGPDFEKGLASMKTLAEATNQKRKAELAAAAPAPSPDSVPAKGAAKKTK